MIFETNGTFEKFGGSREFQKNIDICKNNTFENFGGSREFQKKLIFDKNGTFAKYSQFRQDGTPEIGSSDSNLQKMGHVRNS